MRGHELPAFMRPDIEPAMRGLLVGEYVITNRYGVQSGPDFIF